MNSGAPLATTLSLQQRLDENLDRLARPADVHLELFQARYRTPKTIKGKIYTHNPAIRWRRT